MYKITYNLSLTKQASAGGGAPQPAKDDCGVSVCVYAWVCCRRILFINIAHIYLSITSAVVHSHHSEGTLLPAHAFHLKASRTKSKHSFLFSLSRVHINTCTCETEREKVRVAHRLPLTVELHNAAEMCTSTHTKRTTHSSSPVKRVASSIALQGACDHHWNPPFIREQSLNNTGPSRGMRALSGACAGLFKHTPGLRWS